jgi:hypothetical protein
VLEHEKITMKRRSVVAAVLLLCLIATVGAAGVITDFNLKTEQAAFWDISVKAIGGFVAIAGALLTAAKYLDDKAASEIKPFADLKGAIYAKFIQATATIANSPAGSKARRNAEASFWVLYWGEAPLVADTIVGAILDKFADAILDRKGDGVLHRNLSMDLARACRSSLGFPKLPPVPPTRSSAVPFQSASNGETN